MKRIVALGTVVVALVAAAVTAWVDELSKPDRPVRPVAAVTTYAPPQVVVDPGVDVDRAEVEAYVAHLANDPRGWRTNLNQYTVRIVRPGKLGTQRMPGTIGTALLRENTAVVSGEAWNVLGPKFGAAGGTLDDQRTWVVLHELGHLIEGGGKHTECSGDGPAPVMRAITYEMGDCDLNVWPNP